MMETLVAQGPVYIKLSNGNGVNTLKHQPRIINGYNDEAVLSLEQMKLNDDCIGTPGRGVPNQFYPIDGIAPGMTTSNIGKSRKLKIAYASSL
jgi:hypothetical protein